MTGVLVTGASGFIGLPVVTRLANRGEEVHALHTRPLPPRIPGVVWHKVDLLGNVDINDLILHIEPERLVHLAWYTEHGRVMSAPENIVWVERSLQLTRAFVKHGGRRLVLIGSCAEYDWSNVAGPFSESRSRLAPGTLYGVAKDALRRMADTYARQEGTELAWGRPFFLYGPREAPERLVPSVIRSLLMNKTVATSSGRQVRDYMHVEDLADAIIALLDSSLVGEVNLASGIGVSLDEMIDRIVRSTGHPELVLRGELPDRPWESQLLVADVARLRDELGFRPRWSLTEGLDATVRWWGEQSEWKARRGVATLNRV